MVETVLNNPGLPYDKKLIEKVHINLQAIHRKAATFKEVDDFKSEYKIAWLLKAIDCIDLTTLGGDDTAGNVARLCHKAVRPVSPDLLKLLGYKDEAEQREVHTAAVCVYPSRVEDAYKTLKTLNCVEKINIASVATGFPSGQYPLETRIAEIKYAVEKGATEIDIVIDRSLLLTGQWSLLYDEIYNMKNACGTNVHLKAILATGELVHLKNVYKASMIAMMAGADFIKTSTGKESINATIPYGIVMCKAIKDYESLTNVKVGLKPAGGIRTHRDAISWLIMVKSLLGNDWLSPKLFRFGASGLLTDIECTLYELATGQEALLYEFTMG